MADFPSYAKFVLSAYAEEDEDPSVLRTEMERGIPVERVINKDIMQKISGTILFLNDEDIERFETWFFDEIERIGWFNLRHPRTRQMIRARFIGGKRGQLMPTTGGFGIAQRSIELEYMR
jgi:hypothetical protein